MSLGSSAEYSSTVPFFNAAATMAETLNVFLLFALPMDALKIAQRADDSAVRLQYLGSLLTFHADAQP